MLFDFQKTENAKGQAKISFDVDEFKSLMTKAYQDNKKRFNVPGFRKGRAPMNMALRMYGEGVLYDDALKHAMNDEISKRLMEERDFYEIADSQVDKIGLDQGAELTLELILYPDLKLPKLSTLKVQKVTLDEKNPRVQEGVEEELKKLQKNTARMESHDEDYAACQGDTAVIDFEGKIDGVPFDGGKGEKHQLVLGSGQFIPGFEEQVIGHKVGETFDIQVTFPEDYHEELKGKDAVFTVTIRELKSERLPELDDDFAMDVSEFDTLDEFKKSLSETVLKRLQDEYQKKFEQAARDALLESVEADIPEAMGLSEARELYRNEERRAKQYGIEPAQFFQYFMGGQENVVASCRAQGEMLAKYRAILHQLSKDLELEVTDEDLEKNVKEFAQMHHVTEDQAREAIQSFGKSYLALLRDAKAEEELFKQVKITEVKGDKIRHYDEEIETVQKERREKNEARVKFFLEQMHANHPHHHHHEDGEACDCGCEHEHEHEHEHCACEETPDHNPENCDCDCHKE